MTPQLKCRALSALTAVFLLAALVQLPRTPLPWFDEILLVSTAQNASSGHTVTPSVLAAFPHSSRYDLFYGPVIFWIGAVS